MTTINETIAQNIRKRRKAMGLSQNALGKLLTTTHSMSVSQWERGLFCPGAFSLCALADVFGCSVDELLGRSK